MKRHIGKLLCILGIVTLYPLSGVLTPWVTRAFFCHRMPDGQIVILDVNSGMKGFAVCLIAGVLILIAGIVVEVMRVMDSRKANAR